MLLLLLYPPRRTLFKLNVHMFVNTAGGNIQCRLGGGGFSSIILIIAVKPREIRTAPENNSHLSLSVLWSNRPQFSASIGCQYYLIKHIFTWYQVYHCLPWGNARIVFWVLEHSMKTQTAVVRCVSGYSGYCCWEYILVWYNIEEGFGLEAWLDDSSSY